MALSDILEALSATLGGAYKGYMTGKAFLNEDAKDRAEIERHRRDQAFDDVRMRDLGYERRPERKLTQEEKEYQAPQHPELDPITDSEVESAWAKGWRPGKGIAPLPTEIRAGDYAKVAPSSAELADLRASQDDAAKDLQSQAARRKILASLKGQGVRDPEGLMGVYNEMPGVAAGLAKFYMPEEAPDPAKRDIRTVRGQVVEMLPDGGSKVLYSAPDEPREPREPSETARKNFLRNLMLSSGGDLTKAWTRAQNDPSVQRRLDALGLTFMDVQGAAAGYAQEQEYRKFQMTPKGKPASSGPPTMTDAINRMARDPAYQPKDGESPASYRERLKNQLKLQGPMADSLAARFNPR
jgi:hypothetical protein